MPKNTGCFLSMKKILSLFVLFLLVNSMFVVAEDDVSTSDCGFFCSVGEFLWGSSENRVGKGWFDRGNLVGMADEDGEEQEGFYEISTNDGKVYLQLQEGETIQGRPDWTHTGYHTLSTNKREYIFYDIGTYRFTDKDTQTTRFYSKEGRLVSASITDDDYKYTYLHLGGESPRYTKSPLSGGPSESIGYADREIKNQLVPDQSEIKILTEQEYVTIQTSSVDSREQDDGGAAAVANTERLERQQAELFINNAGAGNLVAVKKYVNDGGDINAKRNGINTALYAAAYNGKLDVVKYLLDQPGIDINLGEPNRKITPLHIAVIRGHTEVVESLLRAGADTNARDYAGRTPLELAGDNSIIKDIFEQQFSRNEQVELNSEDSTAPQVNEVITSTKSYEYTDYITLLIKQGLKGLNQEETEKLVVEEEKVGNNGIANIIKILFDLNVQPFSEQQPETQSLTESQQQSQDELGESLTDTESAKRQYVETFIQGQNLGQGPSRCGSWVRESSKEMGLSEVPPADEFLFHAWEAEDGLIDQYGGEGDSLTYQKLNNLREGDFVTVITTTSKQLYRLNENGEKILDNQGNPIRRTDSNGQPRKATHIGRVIEVDGELHIMHQLGRDGKGRVWTLEQWRNAINGPLFENPRYFRADLPKGQEINYAERLVSSPNNLVSDFSQEPTETSVVVDQETAPENYEEFTQRVETNDEGINSLEFTLLAGGGELSVSCRGSGCKGTYLREKINQEAERLGITLVGDRPFCNGNIGVYGFCTTTIDDSKLVEGKSSIEVVKESIKNGQIGLAAARVDQETGDPDLEDELEEDEGGEMPGPDDEPDSQIDEEGDPDETGDEDLDDADLETELVEEEPIGEEAEPQAVGEQPQEETAQTNKDELNKQLKEELWSDEPNLGRMRQLIEQGADVNTYIMSFGSEDAIYHASIEGNYEMMKFLLDKGATNKDFPLYIAAGNGDLDVVKLLVDRGATNKDNALNNAVGKGHTEIVKLFLNSNIEIDEETKQNAQEFLEAARQAAAEQQQDPNVGLVPLVSDTEDDTEEPTFESDEKALELLNSVNEENKLTVIKQRLQDLEGNDEAQKTFLSKVVGKYPELRQKVLEISSDSDASSANIIGTGMFEKLIELSGLSVENIDKEITTAQGEVGKEWLVEFLQYLKEEKQQPSATETTVSHSLDENTKELTLTCSGPNCNKQYLSTYFVSQKDELGISKEYGSNCNSDGTSCVVNLDTNYDTFANHFQSIAISGNVELQPGYKFELDGETYRLTEVNGDQFIVNVGGVNEPLTREEWLMDVNDHRRSQVQHFTYNGVEYKRVTDFRNTALNCNAYDCAHVFRSDGGETLIYNSDNELFGFYSVATGLLSNEGLEDYGYKYARLIFEEQIGVVADEEEREYRANNYMQTEIGNPKILVPEKVEELGSVIGAHSTESTSETRDKLITLLVESGQEREGLEDLDDAQLNQRASEISNEYRVRNLLAKIASATSSSEITEHQYDRDPRVQKATDDRIGVLLPPEDAIALRGDIDHHLSEEGVSERGVEKVQEIIGNTQNDKEVIDYAREQLDDYYQRTIVQQLGSGNLDLANEIIENPENYGKDMVAIAQIELQEHYRKVVDQQIALGNFGTVSEMIKNEGETYNDDVVEYAKEQLGEEVRKYTASLLQSGMGNLGQVLSLAFDPYSEVTSDSSNPKYFYYEDNNGNLVKYVETDYSCPTDYDCSGGTYKPEWDIMNDKVIVFNEEGEMVGIDFRDDHGLVDPDSIGRGFLSEFIPESYKLARRSSPIVNDILDEDISLEELGTYLDSENLQVRQVARETYYQRLSEEGIVVNKIDTDLLGELTESIGKYNDDKRNDDSLVVARATERNSQNLDKVIRHISEITGIPVENLQSLTPEQLEQISAQVQNKATDANNKLITIRTGEDFNQIADLESDPNPLVSTSAGDMMDSYLFRDEEAEDRGESKSDNVGYFYDESKVRYDSVLNVENIEGCTVLKCGYVFEGKNGKIIIYDNQRNPIGTATTENRKFVAISDEDDRETYGRIFDSIDDTKSQSLKQMETKNVAELRALLVVERSKLDGSKDPQVIAHLEYIIRVKVMESEVDVSSIPKADDIISLRELKQNYEDSPNEENKKKLIELMNELTTNQNTELSVLNKDELIQRAQKTITGSDSARSDYIKIQSASKSEDIGEDLLVNGNSAVREYAKGSHDFLKKLETRKEVIDNILADENDQSKDLIFEIIENKDGIYDPETVAYAETKFAETSWVPDSSSLIDTFTIEDGINTKTFQSVSIGTITDCPTGECIYATKEQGSNMKTIYDSEGNAIGFAGSDNVFKLYSAVASSEQIAEREKLTKAFQGELERQRDIRSISISFYEIEELGEVRAKGEQLKLQYGDDYHEMIDEVVKENIEYRRNERMPLVKSLNVNSVSGTKTYTPFKNTNLIKGCDSNKCAYGFVNKEGFIILYNKEGKFTGYVNTGESTSEYQFNKVSDTATTSDNKNMVAQYSSAFRFAADNVVPSEEGADVDLAAEEKGLVFYNRIPLSSGEFREIYVDKDGNLFTLKIDGTSKQYLSAEKVSQTVKESEFYKSSVAQAKELSDPTGRLERELSALKIHTVEIKGTELFVGSDGRIYNKEEGRLATAEEKEKLDDSDEIKSAVTLAAKRATTMKAATESGVFEDVYSIDNSGLHYVLKPVQNDKGEITFDVYDYGEKLEGNKLLTYVDDNYDEYQAAFDDYVEETYFPDTVTVENDKIPLLGISVIGGGEEFKLVDLNEENSLSLKLDPSVKAVYKSGDTLYMVNENGWLTHTSLDSGQTIEPINKDLNEEEQQFEDKVFEMKGETVAKHRSSRELFNVNRDVIMSDVLNDGDMIIDFFNQEKRAIREKGVGYEGTYKDEEGEEKEFNIEVDKAKLVELINSFYTSRGRKALVGLEDKDARVLANMAKDLQRPTEEETLKALETAKINLKENLYNPVKVDTELSKTAARWGIAINERDSKAQLDPDIAKRIGEIADILNTDTPFKLAEAKATITKILGDSDTTKRKVGELDKARLILLAKEINGEIMTAAELVKLRQSVTGGGFEYVNQQDHLRELRRQASGWKISITDNLIMRDYTTEVNLRSELAGNFRTAAKRTIPDDDEQKRALVEMGILEKLDSKTFNPGDHIMGDGFTTHISDEGTIDSVEPPRDNNAYGEMPTDVKWVPNGDTKNGYWEFQGVKLYYGETGDYKISDINRKTDDNDFSFTEGLDEAEMKCYKDNAGGSCYLYDDNKLNAWDIEGGEVKGVNWKKTGTWVDRYIRDDLDDDAEAYLGGYVLDENGDPLLDEDGKRVPNKAHQAIFGISGILTSTSQWRGLTHLLMGKESWYKDWSSKIENGFAKAMGTENLARAACQYEQRSRDKQDGQNSVFIATSPGVYQFVGSIQAEMTKESTYLTCAQDENYDYTVCPGDLNCKDGICYENNNLVKAYQYKISWGVLAPQDVKKTPYIDENGKAVKFNIYLTNTDCNSNSAKYLYERPRTEDKREVIELENGASDRDIIIDNSKTKYKNACICFDNRHLSRDRTSNPVRQICAKIAESEQKEVKYDVASSKATQTTSATVERNSIW